MLRLPSVTLTLYEGRAYELASLAIKDMMSRIEFAEVIVYSDRKPSVDGVRWIETPPAPREHSTEMVTEWSGRAVNTPHFIQAQWDSGILQPEMWSDEFLEYDFVGAPWGMVGDNLVGCGGFALYSRRLIGHLFENRDRFPSHASDTFLCRVYRQALEKDGFRWPSVEVANRFAYERCGNKKAFGYHGIFNMAWVLPMEEFVSRSTLDEGYMRQKSEWQESVTVARI